MSHRHFCDYAGHEWECEGTALRPIRGDTEPSTCMCLNHQVSMEDGDHSMCSIELLACPEHREAQLQKMGTVDRPDEESQFEQMFAEMNTPEAKLKFEQESPIRARSPLRWPYEPEHRLRLPARSVTSLRRTS